MAFKILFRPSAVGDIKRLDPPVRNRILKKILWYAAQNDPCVFAHRLTDPMLGTYRYRVGIWRIIFDVQDGTIIVLVVDKRSDVYR